MMVRTRSMKARPFDAEAEEKKDDDDYLVLGKDNKPQSIDYDEGARAPLKTYEDETAHGTDDAPSPPPPKVKKSPLLLLLCASGITSCYLWYGTIQEHVYHMDAADQGEGGDDNPSITLFLLATSTFSSFFLASVWTVVGPILLSSGPDKGGASSNKRASQGEGGLNHPLLLLTSLTYLSAMAASNESLHYVSYPTCVLAKSSKLIPTMIVGWLVDQWRSWRRNNSRSDGAHCHRSGKTINAMEWIGAALITVGILSFQYIQLHKQDHSHSGKEVKGDSPYGLCLLGFSLFMDGLLGACQSTLKRKDDNATVAPPIHRPPSAMETMLYINLYATLMLLPASHCMGQLRQGMNMLLSSGGRKSMLLFQLNLSASLGQVFIFLTIHHFSPLTCTTITTTRKFFTILLSVYKFGHVLGVWQWISVGLVFGGLYLEIVAKIFEQHESGHDHQAEKKKQE
ncbi:hypothetical protein ACHAWF_009212 [Thalassiosira exigua]